MKKLVLLFVLVLTLFGCQQSQKPAEPEKAEKKVEPKTEEVFVECTEDETYYQVENTPVKLCYPNSWEDPQIQDIETLEGKLSWLSFSNFQMNGIEAWFESEDFVGTGGDVTYFDFGALNLEGPDLDKQIAEILNIDLNEESYVVSLEAEKVMVSERPAVKVTLDYENEMEGKVQEVRYYIPNAFADTDDVVAGVSPPRNIHMTVSAPLWKEAELDKMMEGIVIVNTF